MAPTALEAVRREISLIIISPNQTCVQVRSAAGEKPDLAHPGPLHARKAKIPAGAINERSEETAGAELGDYTLIEVWVDKFLTFLLGRN
jgi:hypothetical protein